MNDYQDSVPDSGEIISLIEFKLRTRTNIDTRGRFQTSKIAKDLRTGITIYVQFSIGDM